VAETSYPLRRPSDLNATRGAAYYLRVLRVIGGIEFKVKYADSILGYVWSLAKPLAYFGVLWLVFDHLLRATNETRNFTVWLLIGVLLFTFFVDAVNLMLPSIVNRGAMLRRISFPPALVPLSISVGVCMTFAINVLAVVVYVAIAKVTPSATWLVIVPLLAELLLFILGLGLLLSALYVRFRDIGQLWEVLAQVLFFASAIMYPIGILPLWAQRVAFLNPFVQVMQDIRHVMLGGSSGPNDRTAAAVYAGAGGRLLPIAITLVVVVLGLTVFTRESRYFAERI
jgi:ABC-2 type transport system permease protein